MCQDNNHAGFITNTIRENIFFILSITLLLTTPNFLLLSLTKRYVMFNLGFASFWILVELILKSTERKLCSKTELSSILMNIIKTIVWIAVFFLTIVNVFLILNFNSVLNAYFLELLSETNGNETSEFIYTYILSHKSLLIVLIIFGVISVSMFADWIIKRVKKRQYHIQFVMIIALSISAIRFCSLTKFFGSNYIECYGNH